MTKPSSAKTVNTWITTTGAIHMDKSSTKEITMTTAHNPKRRNIDTPPDFSESDMVSLHSPNLSVRSIHRDAQKFEHTKRRQTFKHYLSAIAFIRENKIVDSKVTRIPVNVGEWEVEWANDGGIV